MLQLSQAQEDLLINNSGLPLVDFELAFKESFEVGAVAMLDNQVIVLFALYAVLELDYIFGVE